MRQGQHDVFRRDHAEIAVPRFAGMNEERRGSGAGKGGSDFSADMSRLAHARDNNAASALQEQPAGLGKMLVNSVGKRRNGRRFRRYDPCTGITQ